MLTSERAPMFIRAFNLFQSNRAAARRGAEKIRRAQNKLREQLLTNN